MSEVLRLRPVAFLEWLLPRPSARARGGYRADRDTLRPPPCRDLGESAWVCLTNNTGVAQRG